MTSDDTARVIYLVLLGSVIAGYFFISQRENLSKTLQYAAIWGMLFVGVAAAVGLWNDISRSSLPGQISVSDSGQIVVPRSFDGHYYLSAQINGANVRFVVDTGATDLVLTQEDAVRAGLDPENLVYSGRARTANGEVRTSMVRLDEVRLGPAVDRNVGAVVNGGEMDQSLLGMGYLERWGHIQIANGELILTR